MRFTNENNLSASVAVWLAHDTYDFSNPPVKTISATSLIKSTRQIILSRRAAEQGLEKVAELSEMMPSRLGHSLHDAIEQAWKSDKLVDTLISLNIPKKVAERVRINPSQKSLEANPNILPVYMEKRSRREIDGYTVSGKFDFVMDGRVEDFKSTSTFSYTSGSKDKDYVLQGSIYRWLNPDIITEDHMAIQFIFTDWSAKYAKSDKSYPQSRVLEHRLQLMSVEETESWVRTKVGQIELYTDKPEAELPLCTDEDLWRAEPVYKYYSNPANITGRATKNFKDENDAIAWKNAKGKGVVIEVFGEVKACLYCHAFHLCTQKDRYIQDGSLSI